MGFMDKAKKLAEQAQAKADEVQKQFNERQGGSSGAPSGPVVEYDQHGRPIGESAAPPPPPAPASPTAPTTPMPAASAPPPPAPVSPPGPTPAPAASAPPPGFESATEPGFEPEPEATAESAGPPAPPPSGGLQTPDREDTAPPKMSSGDPLAG